MEAVAVIPPVTAGRMALTLPPLVFDEDLLTFPTSLMMDERKAAGLIPQQFSIVVKIQMLKRKTGT